MKKIIIGFSLFLAVLICQIPGKTIVYAKEVEKTPQDWIVYWADKYGVSSSELLAIAKCESGFNPNALNATDGDGGSRGLFQYQNETFSSFSQSLGEDLDIWSMHDQAKLTAYAFSKGLKSHWSCFYLVQGKSPYKRM